MNTDNPWGITREEVLELAATKLAKEMSEDYEELEERLHKEVRDKIAAAAKTSLPLQVDRILSEEIDKVLAEEIVPVNIWGAREGKPTTLRALLSESARNYWDQKVNNEGKPMKSDDYYVRNAKSRSEWLFGTLVAQEFATAVSQNITNIVAALKDSLKADAIKTVSTHIDNIIKVKTLKE